jgi:RHS repeat-associated protein
MKLAKPLLIIFAFVNAFAIKAQITVNAFVNHASPSSTTNVGNISLNVSGGTSPYTYLWNPGNVTTSNRVNITRNNYSVKVKDAANDSVIYNYSLGYKTNWTNFLGLVYRNDSIIVSPNNIYGWGNAVSKNTLKANIDGWAELVLNSDYVMLGFQDSTSVTHIEYTDIDYGFYKDLNYLFLIENGYYFLLGNCNIGDAVKIERIGGIIYYNINGVTQYTSSVATDRNWKLKVALNVNSVCNIGASFMDTTEVEFPNYVQEVPTITHCTPGQNNGSINVQPKINGGSYSHTWSPGSYTTSEISNLTVGIYSVNTKDSDLNLSKYNYQVGYKTNWTNFFGTLFRNDTLTVDPALSYSWPFAISKNTLKPNTDGWAQIVFDQATDYCMLGFHDSTSFKNNSYTDIDYGFYKELNRFYLIVNGNFYLWSNCEVGDIVKIERIGTTYNIKINNIIMYTTSVSAEKNWKLKVSLNSNSISNIGASFVDSTGIDFPNYVNNSVLIKNSSGLYVNDGVIELSPRNGQGGYTYSWTPGNETTPTVSNKSFGSYNVTITDELANTSSFKYDVLYKTKWDNLEGCFVRKDSLIWDPLSTYGWNIATSKNILKGNTDGEISWMTPKTLQHQIVGFFDTAAVIPNDYTAFDHGFYYAPNTVYNALYYVTNGNFTFIGSSIPGDVLKIKRKADTIYYLLNETILTSEITTNKNVDWRVKTAFSTGYNCGDVGCSFNTSLNATVKKEHADFDNLKNGFAYVVPENGVPTYTVSWNDSLISNSRNDLAPGIYIATVKDSTGDEFGKEIKIGVKPNWNIKQNVVYVSDSITKFENNQKAVLVSHNLTYNEQEAWFENKILNKNTDLVFGFIGTNKSNIDSNYIPPVFPSGTLEQNLVLANQLYNKAIHDSLNYVNGSLNIGGSAENLFFVRIHNGTILSLLQGAPNTQYNFNDGDVLKIGRNSSGNIYFSVNDNILFSNASNISNQYLVSSILLNSNKANISETGIFSNSLSKNIGFQVNPNPFCANDACRTWVTSKTFDENGNVINQGKQYYDQFGRPTQSQQKSFSINNVLASESFYDAFGRSTGNTLVAPTWQTSLCYKNDFFARPNGVGHYSVIDFDKAPTTNLTAGELNNPSVVGNQNKGQLGWYYSNNNTDELSVPADGFPYSRVEYSDDPLGRVVRQSGVGENHRMGTNHEMTTLYSNSGLELNQVFPKFSNELKEDFTLKKYNSTDYNVNLKTIHKTTTQNQDGKLSFTFTDNFGKVAATCVDGGEDVLCDNGYGINQILQQGTFPAVQPTSGPPAGHVQVHIPKEMINSLYLKTTGNASALYGMQVWEILSPTLYNNIPCTYNPVTGKLTITPMYQTNSDLDVMVSYIVPGNVALPNATSVSLVSKLNYTQWTLYYYDVKGRLKAVQSPYDVSCSPKVTYKTLSQTSPVAFDCNSSNTILSVDLKIGADAGSAVSPETAKISFSPVFNYSDTIATKNVGNLSFETSNLSKIDTTGNFFNYFGGTFVPVQSDTLNYSYNDSIQDTISIANNTNLKAELFGKQIRYKGKYLVGIKKLNNSITYFEDKPIDFDYTLKLDGVNSVFTNNSVISELGFEVPQDSLVESSEIIIKNIELKMSLKGFGGISPASEFSPCDQQLYIDPNNAAIIQLVNSNVLFKAILVSTLPPANTPPTTPQFSKKYWYNEYDQIIASETKDEGLTYFLYDLKESKLRYSQNAKQRTDGKFSYINYDKIGRVIETGEYDPTLPEPIVPDPEQPFTPPLYVFQYYYSTAGLPANSVSLKGLAQYDNDIYIGSQRKTQQSYLSYDLQNSPPNSPPFIHAYGKVSKAWNANSQTWYQYNERGELLKTVQDINGLGIKTFDYTYDWRGKLLSNIADQSAADEFKHLYQYDNDERLKKVSAVKGNTIFDINYLSYYLHGALKRNVIGGNLQGLDYVYTINGGLKSVNNPFAGTFGNDPGFDGVANGPNQYVKPDAFAYTLDYFPGDYKRSQGDINLEMAFSNFNNENISYTGYIQSMRWKTQLPVNATNNFGNNVLMYEYNYDNLYRLKAAKFGVATPMAPICGTCPGYVTNTTTNDYALDNITYDQNGNIQTLKRYSKATGLGNPQIMDDLTYNYNNVNNKNNQLLRVLDANVTNLSLTTEIDLPNQATTNYSYNNIGELNYSLQDNYSYTYYYTGLIKEVKNKTTNLPIASFEYNHLNLRQSKTAYDPTGVAISKMFYVYNEAGDLTSTYQHNLTLPHNFAPPIKDHILYGVGKAGIYDITAQKPFFELNDHLGNVRSVICETQGNLEVLEFTDYYPHGGILPGRQVQSGIGYRFAYQGQEKDDETKLTNFELRQYDPRIGRWNNPDPYQQHHSPYLAMSNNPVSSIDPDGGEDDWGPTLYETATQQNNPDAVNNYQNSDPDYTHISGSIGGGINANNSFTSNDQMVMDAQINNIKINHNATPVINDGVLGYYRYYFASKIDDINSKRTSVFVPISGIFDLGVDGKMRYNYYKVGNRQDSQLDQYLGTFLTMDLENDNNDYYNFVQNFQTNVTAIDALKGVDFVGKNIYYADPERKELSKDEPRFFYFENEARQNVDPVKGRRTFDDYPGRMFSKKGDVHFIAETTIVKRENGKIVPVATFTWGFKLLKNGTKITLPFQRSKEPSEYQTRIINGLK